MIRTVLSSQTAEIITLRAIALKQDFFLYYIGLYSAEIITLRAIALKPIGMIRTVLSRQSRDHNATSYSTETIAKDFIIIGSTLSAEIITLRAIALKH